MGKKRIVSTWGEEMEKAMEEEDVQLWENRGL